MNKLSLVILLVLTSILPGWGQKIVPSPADLYDEALEYIFAGEYNEALPVLKSLEDKGYHTANISYKIGECFLNLPGLKANAIPYLKEAIQKISADYSGATLDETHAPVKALLYLGIAYRLNNDLTNALDCFHSYLEQDDGTEAGSKALAAYHIERCNNAQELFDAPAQFSTDTLSEIINSSVSNFNPLVTPDERVIYYMNQLKFYDAIMRTGKNDSLWQVPENLTPEIKSDGDHYLTGMSTDGTRLFFTFYDPYRSGEIYSTEFREGKWTGLARLNDKINTIFNETHASLSPDGKVLYFTSDRKGGFGGLDIYRSDLASSGDWDEPVNLGPLINTPYNEETPFVAPISRKLFFSSQGHYNMGGYDVFMSTPDDAGKWLPPVNIGYPLNTTDDDLFFFPTGTGNIAYQSEYTESSVQQDILRYNIRSFGNPARFTVNGKVVLRGDTAFSPDKISVAFIGRPTQDTLAMQHLQHDGTFRQKLPGGMYKVDFSDESQLLLSKELNIPDYSVHNQLVLNTDLTILSKFAADTLFVRDIRFGFDKSQMDRKYESYLVEIVQKMMKYPGLTLTLNGYADSKGSEDYNRGLSLSRAGVVGNFLMGKASLDGRITMNGYGEESPVAVNVNADGTDNPLGRSYNRRVELLFSGSPDGLTVIRISDLPEDIKRK